MDRSMAAVTSRSSTSIIAMPSMTTAPMASGSSMTMTSSGPMTSMTCKTSMFFNFYTIDACFLTTNWRITSTAVFAGSIVAVVFLAMLIELLRRAVKEYDKRILQQHRRAHAIGLTEIKLAGVETRESRWTSLSSDRTLVPRIETKPQHRRARPTFTQQLIRALLHTTQLVGLYLMMILVMYFNVYIIFAIIFGIFIGYTLFSWEAFDTEPEITEESTTCH